MPLHDLVKQLPVQSDARVVPEAVRDGSALEVTGRSGDAPIQESLSNTGLETKTVGVPACRPVDWMTLRVGGTTEVDIDCRCWLVLTGRVLCPGASESQRRDVLL